MGKLFLKQILMSSVLYNPYHLHRPVALLKGRPCLFSAVELAEYGFMKSKLPINVLVKLFILLCDLCIHIIFFMLSICASDNVVCPNILYNVKIASFTANLRWKITEGSSLAGDLFSTLWITDSLCWSLAEPNSYWHPGRFLACH